MIKLNFLSLYQLINKKQLHTKYDKNYTHAHTNVHNSMIDRIKERPDEPPKLY